MLILLNQMIVMLLLMLTGYFLARFKVTNDGGIRVITAIVLDVATPGLIISKGMSIEADPIHCLIILGGSFLYFAILIGLSFLIPLILRVPRNKVSAYRVMTVFSNIGFMGLPLISAMYDAQTVLDLAIFNITYNILIYTFGIAIIGGKNNVTPKKILNIGTVCSVLALVFAFLPINYSDTLISFTGHLGNLTAPLSMIVIGASFLGLNPKALLLDFRLIIFTLIKMLIIPICGILILRYFGLSGNLLGLFMVVLATPVGSMTAMMARKYDGDIDTTSKGVALTTLVSVITMTLVSTLLV